MFYTFVVVSRSDSAKDIKEIKVIIMELSPCNSVRTDEELISSAQAATLLGVSESSVRSFKARGLIKAVPNTTSRTYFSRSQVEAFKKTRQEMKEKRKRESMGIL